MAKLSAKEWLDKEYPTDDTPPFGDESLKDDPAYQTIHIIMRGEVPEMLERWLNYNKELEDGHKE